MKPRIEPPLPNPPRYTIWGVNPDCQGVGEEAGGITRRNGMWVFDQNQEVCLTAETMRFAADMLDRLNSQI